MTLVQRPRVYLLEAAFPVTSTANVHAIILVGGPLSYTTYRLARVRRFEEQGPA